MKLTRRDALGIMGFGTAWAIMPPLSAIRPVSAAADTWQHGVSLFGEPKYPPDFGRFDYVNPAAPKGGRVRLQSMGTFDSLNPFTFRGQPAGAVQLIFDSLMTAALDEPGSEYGLVAEMVRHPADFSSVSFLLRETAVWHDGQPITPDDVIFSLESLKTSHPFYASYYGNVLGAERIGDREVAFTFTEAGNRELPQIVGQLPIIPKHWWTATGPNGNQRSILETTLEFPLGSGPYKVARVDRGRSVTLARVEDYWARDLPVNVGRNNIDEITVEYFRDENIALEAFKGDAYDWRAENSAKNWATGYDFPAVRRGDVVLEEFHVERSQGMQAFAFNTRKSKFGDARLRRAFNYAFNFEWTNENIFYGQYERSYSYFSGSELAATELPDERELAILQPLRDQIPPEVFTEIFHNPVNEDSRALREHLRIALGLLEEAGWSNRDGRLVNTESGEALTAEFLLVSPLFLRIVEPYVQNLERLGIQTSIRTVDSSQYRRRLDTFDFDIIVANWPQSLSPGNEQRDFWSSEAADQSGSRNYVGIKNSAVDALIDTIIFAEDRESLVAACRSLDRVLLWNHYVVPQWHIPYERTARWNRFSHPENMPAYAIGFPTIWWFDDEKAASIRRDG